MPKLTNSFGTGSARGRGCSTVQGPARSKEIAALRASQELLKPKRSVMDRMSSLMQDAVSDVLLYFQPPKEQPSMCKNYGHVFNKKNWNGLNLPKCSDCGAEITSPSELRTAQPRTTGEVAKPQGEWTSKTKW
jgi:hypothetical protein